MDTNACGESIPCRVLMLQWQNSGVPGSWILNEWCDIEEMVTDVTSVKNNFMMWLCVCVVIPLFYLLAWQGWRLNISMHSDYHPDSKVHGVNMGPTWVLSAPRGPHVGPMNLAIRVQVCVQVRNQISKVMKTQALTALLSICATNPYILWFLHTERTRGPFINID